MTFKRDWVGLQLYVRVAHIQFALLVMAITKLFEFPSSS